MRVGIALVVLLALYILGWVIHNAWVSLHRIKKTYENLDDQGCAPIVQIAASTPRPLA